MSQSQEKKTAKAAAAAARQNGSGDIRDAAQKLTVNNFGARQVSFGLGNMGQGFMALAVCVYSGAFAYNKFRQVLGQSSVASE